MCEAFANSLQVGVVSTLIATALGTLVAIALVRFRFRGRALDEPADLPADVDARGRARRGPARAVPRRVRVPLGFGTVVAAHVLFCISFVVVTVKARVASLDPALEEAAADLYASPWQAFWRVTFPLLIPGIAAAALLAFSLSFDDFIVTNFTSGSYTTFPKFVYVSATRGIPPQANVISSFMFVLALAIVVLVQVLGYARSKRLRTR